MIGLPTETLEDVAEIVKLTRDIRRRLATHVRGVQITLTVSSFIPKAQTPFQREAMMTVQELKRRMNYLKRELSREGVAVRTDSAEWAEVQSVLARGDRRLEAVIAGMKRNSLSEWRRAMGEAGLSVDFYARRAREEEESLPWELIRSGVRAGVRPIGRRGSRGEPSP
jgi:radical SAM superfamily enzyme YgiQ (UPF0313 family)